MSSKFMFECNMVDLGFNDTPYTWDNGQLEARHNKERLDRVECVLSCCMTFPKAQIFHMSTVRSDHLPIMVHLDFHEVRTSRRFRFEIMWVESEEFFKIANEVWKEMGGECVRMPHFVIENLNRCMEALMRWSKVVLPNNSRKINKLLEEVERCGEGVLTCEKAERIKGLWRKLIGFGRGRKSFGGKDLKLNG